MATEQEPHGGEKIKAKNFELPTIGKSQTLEVPARGVTLTLQNERQETQVGPAVIFTADYPYTVEQGGVSYNIYKPQNDLVHGRVFHATVLWEKDPKVSLRPLSRPEVQKIYDEKSNAYILAREEMRLTQEEVVKLEAQQALYGEMASQSGEYRAEKARDFERKLERLRSSLKGQQTAVDVAEKEYSDASEALATVSVAHAEKMFKDSQEKYESAKKEHDLLDQQAAKAQARVLEFELDRSPGSRDVNEKDLRKQQNESQASLEKANQDLQAAEWRVRHAESLLARAESVTARRKFYVGTLRTPEL